MVEFNGFGGTNFVVLVECKRHRDRVKRDMLMVLKAKKDEIGAHKAMMFSTAGFQSGALEYAKAHGIAAVQVTDGGLAYLTKAQGLVSGLPPWAPVLVAWMVTPGAVHGRTLQRLISQDETDALREFLRSGAETPALA